MNRNMITELDEQRLDELMSYVPDYSEQNEANIKRIFLEKTSEKHRPISVKRSLAGAFIAAALIACSGIAFAATIGFDFGGIYNSFFHNPDAEHKIEIGKSVEKNGIKVTLLSAFTDGNRAHALLELQDMEADRLSDSIQLLSKSNIYNVYTGSVNYDESTKRATLALTFIFHEPVKKGKQLLLELDTILSGIEQFDAKKLSFDLAVATQSDKRTWKEGWYSAVIQKSIGTDEWNHAEENGVAIAGSTSFHGEEEPDLRLLPLGDMALGVEGVDWAIVTNIGLLDGRLHLQTKRTDAYNHDYNRGVFCLLDSVGNQIYDVFSIAMGAYEEIVFDISGAPDGYQLAVSGEQIENVIHGPWKMSFAIKSEIPKKSMTVAPSKSPYFTKIDVRCSPVSTSLRFYAVESQDDSMELVQAMHHYYNGFGAPYLTLRDGSVIDLESDAIMFDNLGGSADYVSVYFDIQQLQSITICGEEYSFD